MTGLLNNLKMFDIFKKEIKVSDSVKLYLTIGKEIEGEVIEIGENHVLVKTIDGIKTRFFDKLIGGWDLIASVKQEENIISIIEPVSIPIIEKQTGLKILGKIDLDKVDPKRVRKIPSTPISKEIKSGNTEDFELKGNFKSFEELKATLSERENEKLVPANAVIIKHSESRGFGFLRTPNGAEIFFGYSDIVDSELVKRMLGEKQYLNIQVTYSVTKNYKGEKATVIHLPWRVSKCYEIAKKKFEDKRFDDSLYICNQILSAFPNNYLASDLLKEIENQKAGVIRKPKYTEPVYLRGKKAKDIKNYDEAIRLLKISIHNKEKLDSAVKDLASTYQELGELEKGIEIIEEYIDELQDNSATYNFVANYYASAKDYSKAIHYLDELIDISPNKQQLEVLLRKSFCLIQLKKYQDALDIVEEILDTKPDHFFAKKYQTIISEALQSGKAIEFTDELDTSSFTWLVGSSSKYISYSLDKCDYSGLTQQDTAKAEFTIETLKKLRSFIERAGKSRPRDRAKYQLTEAKLIQIVEPENEIGFREAISKYCNASASAYLTENFPPEVIRFFLSESFSLEQSFRSTARQLLYYIMTYRYGYDTIIEKSNPPLDSIISQIPKYLYEVATKNNNLWDGLLECSINNKEITSFLLSRIFDNKEIFKLIIPIFSKSDINLNPNETKDSFILKWNQLREKKKSEIDKLFATIKSIGKIENLENYTNQANSFLSVIKKEWLSNLETKRVEDIFNNISYSINLYLSQTNFDDKERQKGIIIGQISQLIEEIEEQPTRLSYDGLLPLLKHLEILLNQSFKKLLESSTPKVTLSILGESRFIDDNNNVNVQLAIKNQRGCSPIHDIKVQLNEDQNYRATETLLISSESLKGGEERIISIPLNVSSTILKQEAATINVNLEYKSREKEESNFLINQPLALRFFSSEQFETIPNPYAAIADSGPVKDRKMFFGREKDIEEISNSLLSAPTHKFIDIYGQKRSGKSSLLYHLTQKLKESDKFICIDFTLGSTAKYDSASFFWLILDGIERYIEVSESNTSQRPVFETPRLQELLLNPSIIFYEKVKDLHKELKKFDNWKEKKLLLLIDEFTYLYSATLRNNLDPEFMKTWKAMLEKGLFSAIVIGQDIMPKFKAKFPNEFGVFEDIRLTYLKKEDAEKLIEKPIWDSKNNKSRFIGKAINKILDYTSLNPYYIQIFCARLVDFMNDNKLINVTEADVIDVAKSFVEGLQALPIDKFDNLLNAGDADLEAVPQEETLEILRQIANNSRVLGSCPRESISLKNTEYDDQILDDLLKRDVVSCPNTGYYRIQVQIFNEWLLKH
jgi:tetratricopeptide (TPR) repeat protein